MCGITGLLSHLSVDRGRLAKMAGAISHRGPDDSGIWHDYDTGIGLAHRRLSILDLSPAGHQPMHSANARYVIAFNGEIYNHNKLRAELEKTHLTPSWRGHSDTETLLAAFVAWGIQAALQRCIGMFAMALWDKQTQTLTLARDRIGEKPLYYGWQGDTFLFGSELKALKAHPAFQADIDPDALCLYMRHNYIPAPYSIYRGIHKLLPGTWLQVSRRQPEPDIKTYWSGVDISHQGKAQLFAGSPEEAVEELDTLLKDAVGQQMIADVPLGAFLSGGIDSSTVVALMQAQSSQPIKTFSIGFHEALYNEATHAKAVAHHLGTDHTELYVTPDECMQVIPRLPTLYDEPFSDSSQIPTFLVSQLARQQVTVSLSGDAGDELFAGYGRYTRTADIWGKLTKLPLSLRKSASFIAQKATPQQWNQCFALLGKFKSRLQSDKNKNVGDRIHKAAQILPSSSIQALYHDMNSHWHRPEQVVINGQEPPTYLTGNLPELSDLNAIERMMTLDLLTYLPDDILCKVDRAAMGVSLETRVPFLDHRVVEFAWRLPLEYKLREGQTKWILRQVLYKYVPKELIERPKMGFGVPIDSWLRGPLRDWAEDLLDESRLRSEGFFNPVPIRQKWAEHLAGTRNWQYHLWDVLMFNQWLDHNRSASV